MRISIQHGFTACNVRLSAPCVAGHAPKLTINGAAFTDLREVLGADGRQPGDYLRVARDPTRAPLRRDADYTRRCIASEWALVQTVDKAFRSAVQTVTVKR